jgi:hypothetical protein
MRRPLYPQKRTLLTGRARRQKETFRRFIRSPHLQAHASRRNRTGSAPLFRASTDVFGGDVLNFYNTLERNLRQLVGFFNALGRWRVE